VCSSVVTAQKDAEGVEVILSVAMRHIERDQPRRPEDVFHVLLFYLSHGQFDIFRTGRLNKFKYKYNGTAISDSG
jgi:hypothetical protein